MLDQLQSVGEEEGEGGYDGGGAAVEAAGGVAGYVEYGFGGGCCGGCHFFYLVIPLYIHIAHSLLDDCVVFSDVLSLYNLREPPGSLMLIQ